MVPAGGTQKVKEPVAYLAESDADVAGVSAGSSVSRPAATAQSVEAQ